MLDRLRRRIVDVHVQVEMLFCRQFFFSAKIVVLIARTLPVFNTAGVSLLCVISKRCSSPNCSVLRASTILALLGSNFIQDI
eukprot:752884-Hanusia_phi.AAC.5